MNLKAWRNFDWVILLIMIALLTVSILVILSTTIKGSPNASPHDALDQLVFGIIGLGLFFFTASIDYRILQRYTLALYGLMIGLLVFVHFIGISALGAKRWINVGFFQLQPSEIAKLILIILLAKFFASRHDQPPTWGKILLSGAYVALPLGLVLTQPDLGTALIFIFVWLTMIIVSGIQWRQLATMLISAAVMLPILWPFLKPYQRTRLLTFINPSLDPQGSGYNVLQATIAVGSGEIFGKGLGQGTQSQLNFLPVQHTDFIFAALAEELGFVGTTLLILLYFVLLMRCIRVARNARDAFGVYLAVGITSMLLFHVLINIGMNLSIMPVTGIPLPLVSLGGTSVLMVCISLGILESIILRHKHIDF
jgi:rod shape determining protein RodA